MDFAVADIDVHGQLEAPSALIELQSLRGLKKEVEVKTKDGGGLRFRAMRQEGLRLGAQAGLAERYSMIMEYVDKNETKANVIFSFAGFVNDGNLLVPAIHQAQNQFKVDGKEARIVSNSYTIAEEARIVSSVPTWREWLVQEYEQPEQPHHSLLPRTPSEITAWEQAVQEGWRSGVVQANDIYSDRLNDLTRAVEGRYLYRVLEQKKMIQPSALRVDRNVVTYNGRTMNIGEIIYSVESNANYTSSDKWKPVWSR